jgi:hypothetical protein
MSRCYEVLIFGEMSCFELGERMMLAPSLWKRSLISRPEWRSLKYGVMESGLLALYFY